MHFKGGFGEKFYISPLHTITLAGFICLYWIILQNIFYQIVHLKVGHVRLESQLKRGKFGDEQKVNRQPKV